jgi:hypothetical protein
MEDESFDYDLADIEGVLSELPGQAEEEDEMDDIPREMLTFGTPDGLEDGPISGRNRSTRASSNTYSHKQEPQDYKLKKDCPQVFRHLCRMGLYWYLNSKRNRVQATVCVRQLQGFRDHVRDY